MRLSAKIKPANNCNLRSEGEFVNQSQQSHYLRNIRGLRELDQNFLNSVPKTSTVAAQDHLFLTYNARRFTRSEDVNKLRRVYGLTSLLLARLAPFSIPTFRDCRPLKWYASGAGSLNNKKSIANVEHTLRYLQRAALEALIFHGIRWLEEKIQPWQHSWLQERQLDFGWFSEWPNSRRPLSTTWPWNIKPSLVVLWGVCWMFYDNSTRSAAELRQQLEDEGVESSVWARHTPRTASSNQHNHVTRWMTGGSSSKTSLGFQAPTWLSREEAPGGEAGVATANARHANCTPEYTTTLPGYQSSHPPIFSPYINSYPVVSPGPVCDPPLEWPQNQGSYSLPVPPRNLGNDPLQTSPPAHRHSAPSSVATFSPDYNIWQDSLIHQPQHSQLQPQPPVPNLWRSVPSGSDTHQPYAPFVHQATPQRDTRPSRAAVALSPSLRLPMGHMQNYPSPHSEVSKDETKSSYFSILPGNDMSPTMMHAASPSVESHPSPSSTGRKGEEPPRDASGQMTCNHPTCADTPPVFARRCEWTKHMDKHNRPRENLQEHLRRVHRQVGEAEVEKSAPTDVISPAATQPRRKRRHFDDEDDDQAKPILRESKKRRGNDDGSDSEKTSADEGSRADWSVQVKKLRKELREKEERLKRLEQTVELLTSRLT
ncbi:MAG: hypothetical protein LQ344_000977 [Seirophora lacunosa]|nr:MAG: hypothetical protein LQ344_000977 [Seirophora lacunosa]